MTEFHYEPLFQHTHHNDVDFVHITSDFVETIDLGGESFLKIDPAGLSLLASTALREVSHKLRPKHLEKLASILADPEASANDRVVTQVLLRNAVIAAEGVFPSCQDTGTAAIMGKRGDHVLVTGDDAEALSKGVYEIYRDDNLRYSQVAPLTMYDEKNTGTNLPAQIDLFATKGSRYEFLFVAKGGGSANKFYLYQETKALLRPEVLTEWIWQKLHTLGTAACPPYHLALAIGGLSAEMTMKTTKLATTGYYDELPTTGDVHGRAFRDLELEAQVLELTRKTGIGAQFGGKYFCHDVRVIRLPRHGASCPVGMGVSCSADRNVLARIDKDGLWLERLEENPIRFLPPFKHGEGAAPVSIDLNQPMAAITAELTKHPVGTVLHLNGPMIVGRDIAHAKLFERLEATGELPEYLKEHPIYYAGPAKTPAGHPSGSFGPTTAQRMDPYVPVFQAQGASLVMLAKGNRSPIVAESCKANGGFYLGSLGGPAAQLGKECIRKVEVLDYPELGMEAVYLIQVENFPAFVMTDDKGNDFFAKFRNPAPFKS
ncbi:MAG: fumarate hydratase [Deltaproteobacteria bacterium CG2_30_63_29]|nr:MAG: fumarate hydratase [Deltaproteobacteria bacterium CG2_30_63_29]PIW02598.1 MAG: fumarate hydratase [Deltaproteobacteria bacterium CG17_big_fil_post_rev_8_21_14_2_50_63_7]PJB49009.1 MAG: fumarate hydratase [Deltaproteobacteria bacterium CG_4_9_14_3_um_filter_63_12]